MKFFSGASKTSKGNKIFWGIVVFLFLVMVLELGLRQYDTWKGQQRVAELAAELEGVEQERYDRMAADTIGGRTPLETMNLYIEAVEEEDYGLASKYFVIEKQEEELRILNDSPKVNIEKIINLMKDTRTEFVRYSANKKAFSVHNPILVSFVLYPAGNWKIEEI